MGSSRGSIGLVRVLSSDGFTGFLGRLSSGEVE